MEAGAHRSHLWFHTHLLIFGEWLRLWWQSGKWRSAPGMMATSGITTIREYAEFLLSLEKTEKIVKELGILNYREIICMWKAINILFSLLSRCSHSDIYYTAAIYIFNHCPLIDAVKYFWIKHLGFVCAFKLSFVLYVTV